MESWSDLMSGLLSFEECLGRVDSGEADLNFRKAKLILCSDPWSSSNFNQGDSIPQVAMTKSGDVGHHI